MPSPKMDGDKKACEVCGIEYFTGAKKSTKRYKERRVCRSTACRSTIARITRRASGMGGISAFSKEARKNAADKIIKVKKKIGMHDGAPIFRVPPGTGREE